MRSCLTPAFILLGFTFTLGNRLKLANCVQFIHKAKQYGANVVKIKDKKRKIFGHGDIF